MVFTCRQQRNQVWDDASVNLVEGFRVSSSSSRVLAVGTSGQKRNQRMASIHLYFTRKQVGDAPKRGKPEMRSSCRNSLDLHWLAAGLQVSPTSDTSQSVAILMNRPHCVLRAASSFQILVSRCLFCEGVGDGAAAKFAADVGCICPQCRVCVFTRTGPVCNVSRSLKEW